MKLSHLLLSFALILSIKFTSVSAEETQDPLVGVWTSPYITNDIGDFCCVPTSITIWAETADSYTATYKYPGFGEFGWSSKCDMLFIDAADGGSLLLYKKGDSEDWNSEATIQSEKMYFHSYGSILRVYNQPRETRVLTDQCDFKMQEKRVYVPSSWNNTIFIPIFILVVIIILVAIKKCQNKKANAIMAQNLAEQSHFRSHGHGQGYGYAAPTPYITRNV